MFSVQVVPLLLGVLVGLLLSLVAWGFFRSRRHRVGDALMEGRGDVLVGFLILAAFALGVFLIYVLIGPGF
jgi:hypothetical protein